MPFVRHSESINSINMVALLTSAFFGFSIWLLSPIITEAIEPWDDQTGYYFYALVVSGILIGALFHKSLTYNFIGIYLGQLVFMLFFTPSGPLILIGIIFLAFYSTIAFFAITLSASIRLYFSSNEGPTKSA